MKLIIGGYSQGKLNYVLRKIGENGYQICDGTLPEYTKIDAAEINIIKSDTTKSDTAEPDTSNTIIINHLHTFIKTSIQQGENPKESILDFITKYPDCILISDEIGNGIVPMDAFEREYREQTGRILIELAKEAEEVIRVICGICQKIK